MEMIFLMLIFGVCRLAEIKDKHGSMFPILMEILRVLSLIMCILMRRSFGACFRLLIVHQ